MKLAVLLDGMEGLGQYADLKVMGLALDSRLVKPGDGFFAYAGGQVDGRHFIDEAIQKGARVIFADAEQFAVTQRDGVPVIAMPHLTAQMGHIVARFYGNPAQQMQMVGVTGTSGKTSCSHFVADVLQQLHIPCGVIGTLGIGLYGHIQASSLTTPDAITLQQSLAKFLQQQIKIAAMEVSSHSLDQGRVNGINFTVGIFTNLSRDHLDYHGTMEAYGAAKKRLFALTKYAVINADDAFGRELIAALHSQQKVLSYSANGAAADVTAKNIFLDHTGIHADIVTPWGTSKIHSRLIGKFNLSNLLAVLTTLCVLDVPLQTALDGLTKVHSVPGRMQTFGGQTRPLIVVDYAHKPDALEKVLLALREHCRGKLFCIFGCGGERDRGKRPLMAKIAEQYADQVVVTNDNPRHEKPQDIIAEIMTGFSRPEKIIVEQDRSKAIRDVIQCAAAGDCILIAGKGAETYQQVGDEKIPFSDIEQVREILFDARLAQ